MSKQQQPYSETQFQNQALSGLVRFLARCAVDEYLAQTTSATSKEIPQFVLAEDECACGATSAQNINN